MYWATSHPASAAATRATPAAWPVAMAVRAFTWKKTRSTTTASGRNSATRARNSSDSVRSRSGSATVGGDEITPPATAASDPPRRVTTP